MIWSAHFFKNIELTLGSFHLGPLSASFSDKGLHILRGKNGSGKTSLLKALLGRLRMRAEIISGLQFPVGTVGLEPVLMGAWTVEENLKWMCKLLNRPYLIPGELLDLLPQRVDHLSQGLKRQVELGLILALGFPSLFLDEPLSPLDRTQREIYAAKIARAAATSFILLTTHHEEELFGEPVGIIEL